MLNFFAFSDFQLSICTSYSAEIPKQVRNDILKEEELLLALRVELFADFGDDLVSIFVVNLASANLMMSAAAIRSAQCADVCLASSVQDAVADGD